ncbi:MAG: GatB/YqeY domain-containing protein [Solobacterium sp.]|nr:GatB/YqeY domain-containing protein [Solobacterium sp.]
MGELLTQLRKENMQAMKDKDNLKKGVLSLLIAAIALGEKEGKKVFTKEEELVYVQKELKQTRETLAETPESRPELIEETKAKIALLESYLPAQLSEDEIRDVITKILQEEGLEPVKKNTGTVMKRIMAEYKGQTDGKTVNKVLSGVLK